MPPAARWRFDLQRSLVNSRAWGTNARFSVTAHERLPEGFVLRVGLCNKTTKVCQLDFGGRDIDNQIVHQGAHAYVSACRWEATLAKGCGAGLRISFFPTFL